MNVKPNILVVDDEEEFLECVKDILLKWGFEVDTALTGYEGLQRMSLYHYDLVLLDIIMPLINGLETLKRIRKLDRNIPVIVLTSRAGEKHKRKAMSRGADGYVVKPFNEEILLDKINKLL